MYQVFFFVKNLIMKKFQFSYLLAFVLFGLFITGCDEDGNEITITFDEPVDGGTVAMADCADVNVHIEISASEENHEVEVLIHREGDVDDVVFEYDEHNHDKTFEIEGAMDLCSYPSGTCFHIEVEACKDHDCEEKEISEAEFCLQ